MILKRTALLILSLALILVVSGCGEVKPSDKVDQKKAQQSQPPKTFRNSLGQVMLLDPRGVLTEQQLLDNIVNKIKISKPKGIKMGIGASIKAKSSIKAVQDLLTTPPNFGIGIKTYKDATLFDYYLTAGMNFFKFSAFEDKHRSLAGYKGSWYKASLEKDEPDKEDIDPDGKIFLSMLPQMLNGRVSAKNGATGQLWMYSGTINAQKVFEYIEKTKDKDETLFKNPENTLKALKAIEKNTTFEIDIDRNTSMPKQFRATTKTSSKEIAQFFPDIQRWGLDNIEIEVLGMFEDFPTKKPGPKKSEPIGTEEQFGQAIGTDFLTLLLPLVQAGVIQIDPTTQAPKVTPINYKTKN